MATDSQQTGQLLRHAHRDGIITTPLLNIYLDQAQGPSLPMDAIPGQGNRPSGGIQIHGRDISGPRMGPPLGF